jgi:VanZ family protein
MPVARTSRFAPWLLIAVIALIAYGSLYPFNFEPAAVRGGLWEAFKELSWARAGRGDRISNVLLYVPLGFCVYLWLSARLGFMRTAGVALALGLTVSLSIEIAQAYLSPRVPSLKDLALNVLGTGIGVVAGASWNGLSGLLPIPSRSEAPQRDPAAIAVVLLWIGWRLAPFIPRVDLGQLKGALRPLFDPHLQLAAVISYLCYWLVVGHALFSVTRRQVHVEALLILIAVVLMGRLLVGHQGFIPSELAALLLVLPGMILLDRIKSAPSQALLLCGLAAIVVVERLFPFDFVDNVGSFDALAPLHWAAAGLPIHSPTVLQKLFVLAALWWLLRQLGATNRIAGVTLVLFVISIEFLQLWLPARKATVAEPLLAVAVALGMSLLSIRHPNYSRPRGPTLRR